MSETLIELGKKLEELMAQATPGPYSIEPAVNGFRAPNDHGANDLMIIAGDKTCLGILWDPMSIPRWQAHLELLRLLFSNLPAIVAALKQQEGMVTVPREPTEEMWGGLARDLVMWSRFDRPSGAALYRHLRSVGREIPEWLMSEIKDVDHVPPKGTVAVCIFKAMIAESQPEEA